MRASGLAGGMKVDGLREQEEVGSLREQEREVGDLLEGREEVDG